MTPAEFREARQTLGLTQAGLAALVGRQARNIRQWEAGDRAIDDAAVRLVRAYLDGYRPSDWPA
ncbi:helix-turn-helix domain-containing protein [Cereibacter sphaeroides]|uniref:helix-turn-helix domain-containing protein n=1 Tax=Cereibacter sphaeroides TaxID=1063 RepID=UPI000F53EBAD|nr:helix-turn-helix domain-containing protein [Cereibacter sphaeroides]AZB63135.1 helix-turn-helix domain-containing protein [Cereibacter sphaeroides]AZB67063.1 helix-turn-helix domain-containing protein [Cereibacter sphaeroides]